MVCGASVMVTQNDYSVDLRNGDIGLAVHAAQRAHSCAVSRCERYCVVVAVAAAHIVTAFWYSVQAQDQPMLTMILLPRRAAMQVLLAPVSIAPSI